MLVLGSYAQSGSEADWLRIGINFGSNFVSHFLRVSMRLSTYLILTVLVTYAIAGDCIEISTSSSCGGCSMSPTKVCQGECTKITTCPGSSLWAEVDSISGDTVSGHMYPGSSCSVGSPVTLQCNRCNTQSGWVFYVDCSTSNDNDLPVGWIVFGSVAGFVVLACCCCGCMAFLIFGGILIYQRRDYAQL